jgi:tetratricopeptide (TPR) repeat protein
MQQVDDECDNCRVALQWSITHESGDVAGRGVATLLHFSDHRARLQEGLELLRHALHAQGEHGPLKARLLAAGAHLEYRLDRYAEAEANASKALAAVQAAPDHEAQLQAIKVLGGCSLRRGRLDDAERYFRQALEVAPPDVDPRNAAAMLDNLALIEKRQGRFAQSQRLSMQSLAQFRRLGDFAGEALCLNNLGDLHLVQGDYAQAIVWLREGQTICQRHGLAGTLALILTNLTECAVSTGDVAAGQLHARQALEAAAATGNRAVEAAIKLQRMRLALQRRDLAAARVDLAEGMTLASALGRPSLKLAGVSSFADLLEAQGETEGACRVLAFAAEQPAMEASERAHILERLARLRAGEDAGAAWPAMELDELADRIVAEAELGHAPLIAELRATAH